MNTTLTAGDFVKVKQTGRGRPRKWIIEHMNDKTVTVLAFDCSGDRMEVDAESVTQYMERPEVSTGPDDV